MSNKMSHQSAKQHSSEIHLDENQNEILDHQLNGLPTSKGARTVFSFATPLDLSIIAISCVAAIVAGGLNPLLSVGAPVHVRSLSTTTKCQQRSRFYMVNLSGPSTVSKMAPYPVRASDRIFRGLLCTLCTSRLECSCRCTSQP